MGEEVLTKRPGKIRDLTIDDALRLRDGAVVHGAIVMSETRDESGSYQQVAADLELAPTAGTSEAGDTDFLAPMMSNVSGADLTKTHNYIAGFIAALSVLGARATVMPMGALVAIVMDGVEAADGIVVAHIDGSDPSAQTNVRAAFAVSVFNDHASTGVEYGVDLQFIPGVEVDALLTGTAQPFKITKGLLRSPNNVVILEGNGAPVDGTTGDNFAGKGSLYIDYTNANHYIQAGAIDNPTWKLVTRAA